MTRKRHVRRTDLPWRPATHTVCGRRIKGEIGEKGSLTVAEAKGLPRPRWGERGQDDICQVCRDMGPSWPEWEASPVGRMQRECDTKDPAALDIDLRMITLLIERHVDEFQGLVDGERVLAALAGAPKKGRRGW